MSDAGDYASVEAVAEAVSAGMIDPRRLAVGFRASAFEYCVQVWVGGQIVYEYRAGNHPLESEGYVALGEGVPGSRMRAFARRTASEIRRAIHCPGPAAYDSEIELYRPEWQGRSRWQI